MSDIMDDTTSDSACVPRQTSTPASPGGFSHPPLSEEERSYWVAFSRIRGIGPASFKKLLTFFHGELSAAWKAGRAELLSAGLHTRLVESLLRQRALIAPEEELARLQRLDIEALTPRDQLYPPALRRLNDAPPVLYLRGQLNPNDQCALAIVGTRRMSAYGKLVTEHLAAELARHGVTIVSGLAVGIDTAAHTAALATGGRTIAVLACGLDVLYPGSNVNLARRIVSSGQGALLSEYPPGTYPDSGNFPARNRIIAGLALGVVVTEAPQKSGALITARHALEAGRDVFAVPGNMFSRGSEGVNRLIRDGAHLITSVQDILDALNLFTVSQCLELQQALPDDPVERQLLALLNHEPRHIDELTRTSGLPSSQVAATLLTLELKGMIKQVGAMYYVLAR
ncbi:DNA-processing protein DprA [Thermogemmatispora tikiterensis]|uniref:DNA-processing protein DprA n=1 Tax=Thermogemmatispora tikiterensis TaxID=1825093 RepID=UPI001CB91C18|nr:DNA-processing protein DprA [Thermogemmatispora tikiterensis]